MIRFEEEVNNLKTETDPLKHSTIYENVLESLITVYRWVDDARIEYSYNSVGNRLSKKLMVGQEIIENSYSYYSGTNRLQSDGQYGYVYDQAGNLVVKGNKYYINGDQVIFTETSGRGVEYWEYEYNLQNRLSSVKKNGVLVADFFYDVDGNGFGQLSMMTKVLQKLLIMFIAIRARSC